MQNAAFWCMLGSENGQHADRRESSRHGWGAMVGWGKRFEIRGTEGAEAETQKASWSEAPKVPSRDAEGVEGVRNVASQWRRHCRIYNLVKVKAQGSRRRMPKAPRPKRRRRWEAGEWGGDPPPQPIAGEAYAPPARSKAEPRPKTILVLSRRDRTPLVVMSVMLFDKPENVQ